jgi:trehalose 6-phosphate synthase/phosphatase
MSFEQDRLVVVSNRLPLSFSRNAHTWTAKPSSGGLVTAMDPVLRKRGGVWIGWPGTTETIPDLGRILGEATADCGYDVVPVALSETERDEFYYGYSNEVIWPLFHDLQTLCNFDPSYWGAYVKINQRFADAVAECCEPDDFVWVHDYQLMHVGQSLFERGVHCRLAFFLHIPFPPLDIFVKLPQQQRILRALLRYDFIGFQTRRDERNFVECVRRLFPDAQIKAQGPFHHIRTGEAQHAVLVGSFPIGIDYDQFARDAATEEVSRRAWNFHAGFPDRQLILGVDRLDYTKGIPDRLNAFRNALQRYPELREKLTFIQVVVPSRTDIPKYNDLKIRIERLVGEINGQFSSGNWVPIHYIFRSLEYQELLAYYRTTEIALITPHKDGMNLVAKEFCACSLEEVSVLILSQFAGSADQLKRGAIMVNPYDVEQVADAIYQAIMMPTPERKSRMQKLRRIVKKENIFWWVDSFFRAAEMHMDALPVS